MFKYNVILYFMKGPALFLWKLAVINGTTDERETYSNHLRKCIRTALVLRKQGFQKQDILAICSNKETIDSTVPIFAGQFLGLITMGFEPSSSVDAMTVLFQQVQPKIIFVADTCRDKVKTVLERVKADTIIVTFGKEFEENYLKVNDEEDNFEPVILNDLGETCMIHFSSGSTGIPKPFCLNHYLYLATVPSKFYKVFESQKAPSLEKFVTLRYTNLYWISGSMELFRCTVTGGCRILKDTNSFVPKELWSLIEKYSVTHISLTPMGCYAFSLTTRPKEVNVSSLKEIRTGGGNLHKDIIRDLKVLLPDILIKPIYAMTECGIVTMFDSSIPQHVQFMTERPHSCGLPVPGLYYKIIDLDTGEKCGPNQIGELYIKGKNVFKSCYNLDASRKFDDEGYFKTGDLLTFDSDFCFYFKDRLKSVLLWNYFRIFPHHIEEVLMTHPAVHAAMVIGVPHKTEGHRLMGVVQLEENASKVTEDELHKYLDARVEDHKRLREGIRFIDEFPMTNSGKVHRMKVKEIFLKDRYLY